MSHETHNNGQYNNFLYQQKLELARKLIADDDKIREELGLKTPDFNQLKTMPNLKPLTSQESEVKLRELKLYVDNLTNKRQ